MAKIIVSKIIPNHLKYDFYVDLDQIQRRKEEEIRKQLQVIKQLPGIQKYTGHIDLTEPKQYTPYERRFDYQAYCDEYWAEQFKINHKHRYMNKNSSDKGQILLNFETWDRALFGTLFAMEKGEDDSNEETIMTYAPLLFEILQCVGLPIQEIVAWPMGPLKGFIMGVLDYMDFQFFTTTPNLSYILFTVLFVLVMASVFTFVALMFVFAKGDSRVPLPLVRLLRIVTHASVTWGYQPMITIIFMIVDCDFSSGKGMCDAFPEVPCWEGAQAVFNSLSFFTLVVFVPFTQIVILFLYEFDVKHDVLLAAHSGRYEFVEMATKCILTAESQWVSSSFVLRSICCSVGFIFCMLYIMWMQPYHSLHTNVFASAQYGVTVMASLYSWIALYTEGAGTLVITLFWSTFIICSFFLTFFVGVYSRKIYLARCAITYDFKIPVKADIEFVQKKKPFYVEVEDCYYSTYRGFVYELKSMKEMEMNRQRIRVNKNDTDDEQSDNKYTFYNKPRIKQDKELEIIATAKKNKYDQNHHVTASTIKANFEKQLSFYPQQQDEEESDDDSSEYDLIQPINEYSVSSNITQKLKEMSERIHQNNHSKDQFQYILPVLHSKHDVNDAFQNLLRQRMNTMASVVQMKALQQHIENQAKKIIHLEPPYALPKIKHVSHIDAGVRFLWNKEVRKRKDYILFADRLYKEGLKRFPKHPSLRIHYALFLCHYLKDWTAAIRQLATALRIGATIDNRWIIFYMSKIYEQENSGADLKSADVLSIFRYKNHLSQAEQNFFEAKQKLNSVLAMLSQDEMDVTQMSMLVDELIENEKQSEMHYQALLETHPYSIPVLRGYASLKTDIFRYDNFAQLMFKKADQIVQESKLQSHQYIRKGRRRGTMNQIGARKPRSIHEEGRDGSGMSNNEQGIGEQGIQGMFNTNGDVWFLILKYAAPFSVVIFLFIGVGFQQTKQ
ncbi:MAG: hypothetical protein EZS28_002603 [Streblomastix strix]|uniref:TmcB/TmcC TPR repeats domain-containing protein n=1 Tax=Streblomastix strix TaxID=222440 RepID=A0A5J4X3S8_9EUKA|nr:MAG: hypothetical protein EZS28_002603 [Streblomastix strix]